MNTRAILVTIVLTLGICHMVNTNKILANDEKPNNKNTVEHSDSYWKNHLDPETYRVTRCSDTEPAFSGKYWNNHRDGKYFCSNCGALLFQSKDKFDSGTGWPSFTKAQSESVNTRPDTSLNMKRNEVICKRCGAHLGHLFEDGPQPSGERFCINSAALNFDASKQAK